MAKLHKVDLPPFETNTLQTINALIGFAYTEESMNETNSTARLQLKKDYKHIFC